MAPPRSCTLISTALILSLFAFPASAARLSTDTCTSSNYDYDLLSDPADTWYYRGSGGDSFCTANPQLGSYLCGVNGVKPCSITKTETCQDATYPITCAASPRVFSVQLDSNCDYVVSCEYLDSGSSTPTSTSAPASTGGSTIPGGTLPVGTIPVATTPVAAPVLTPASTVPSLPTKSPVVTIGPGTVPSPTTSTVLPAVVPNLLPKPTDVVLTSAYAIGVVSYSCNKGANFNNVSITANLYSNSAGQALAGSYVSANGSQVFSLAQGTAQVVAVGGTYATPSNPLTDGGYGSLNQTYYTASGTLSLATVTYITQTVPSGGILPRNATCALTPIANVTLPPWQVPFQANFTFYSTYTPPV